MTMSERVTRALRRRGVAATYEYPGFVSIRSADGRSSWETGEINDSWTVDRMTDEGEPVEGFDTGLPVMAFAGGSRDAWAGIVADAVLLGIALKGGTVRRLGWWTRMREAVRRG